MKIKGIPERYTSGVGLFYLGVVNSQANQTAEISLEFNEGTDTVSVLTTGAGRLHWAMFPAAGAVSVDIISGTGASHSGYVDTLAGSVGVDLPTPTPGEETWFACVLTVGGNPKSNTAEVRVEAPVVLTYAAISSTTGSPTIYDYTDVDGTWRAYEWLGDGSFDVSTPGDVDYLMVAGGGGAGGAAFSPGAGGGAGGLLQGTTYLTSGSRSHTIGLGGLGGYSSIQPVKGTDTTALGLVAYGGGAADEATAVNRNGGSGAGRKAGVATGAGTGVAGQGFAGAVSTNTGGEGAAAGGGGAGGVGAGPITVIGGNGGAGIDSSILGFAKGFAGGGVGATPGSTTTATGSHGAAATGATSAARKGGDGTDGTGAGGSGSTSNVGTTVLRGGKGGDGVFIIRVRTA